MSRFFILRKAGALFNPPSQVVPALISPLLYQISCPIQVSPGQMSSLMETATSPNSKRETEGDKSIYRKFN